MLLAVMGSGSHLKRPWDDREHDKSQNQHIGASAVATESGRRFSVDPSSPIEQRFPPILTDYDRPSQVQPEHSWTTNTKPDETLTCRASPQPHNEGSVKRPRLYYDQKESTSAERFNFKSSTANSSVRTPASLSYRQRATPSPPVTMR
jgi:hypothetical protein